MKKPRQRAERGSIKVNHRGDRLQLRWTVARERSHLNLHRAKKLAVQIQQDLIGSSGRNA